MRYYQIQESITEQQVDEVRMGSSDFQKFLQTPLAKSMKAGFEAEVIFQGLADTDGGELEPDWDEDRRARSIQDIIEFFTEGPYSDLGRSEISRLEDDLTDDYLEYRNEAMIEDFNNNAESHIRDYIIENLDDSEEKESIETYLKDNFELSEEEIEELFILGADYRRLYSTKQQKEFIDSHPGFEKFVEAKKETLEKIDQEVDDRVQTAIDESNDDWDGAFEYYMDNEDGPDQEEWLRNRMSHMSDVSNSYGLSWPYLISEGGEGGFSEYSAQRLADSLTDTLDVETTVSSGYHSTRRDESTWIFEPDSSLEPNDYEDMPVEIVSPPMPLDQAVEIMPKFFEWVKENNGYVNDSTGFHMSVSMPDHDMNNLDYVKLALFLGDEYVLQQFGREANYYAKSALKKIREQAPKDLEKLSQYMDKMREGLNQIAKNNVGESTGYGKYTSINPKTGYVEFRSAGGENYMDDMKILQDTMARYGMALSIAMDTNAERQEYAKKLYKLLNTGVKSEDDVIGLFSKYVAKQMPMSALKSNLKQLQSTRAKEKNVKSFKFDDSGMPKLDWNGNYEIYNIKSDSSIYGFNASTPNEALAVLDYWRKNVMVQSLDPANYLVRPNKESNQPVTPEDTVFPFEIRYEINNGGVRTFRVNAPNQLAARQQFLQTARQSVDLDRITIHDVEQL